MLDIFLGRQPIYGRRLELYAYELLFRGGAVDFADFVEGDRATSQVLLNTFTEFGIDRVVGPNLAFVNLTRGFLVGEYPLPLPKSRVVLEILEDVPADEEVLAGVRNLRRKGYRIALDDFEKSRANEALIPLAEIVKVDVLGIDDEELVRRVEGLRPFGKRLLAEKIETREQFDFCHRLGFDLFQGYFLSRPSVIQGVGLSASRVNLLLLLAEIQNPDTKIERVQEVVSQDVTLSYKLLRHINAAIYGMPRQIESIRETVMYLGLSMVKNLASLLLLSQVDDTPHELVVTAMLRARMCANLAKSAEREDPHRFFTAGLFSTLDAILRAPMASILCRLPLGEELSAALLEHEGELGRALGCVVAYERGDWDRVAFPGLELGTIKQAFLEAVAWVEEVDQHLSDAA